MLDPCRKAWRSHPARQLNRFAPNRSLGLSVLVYSYYYFLATASSCTAAFGIISARSIPRA
jgi:hypothetical protein